MKKRLVLSIVIGLLIIGIFAGTCYCTYHFPTWSNKAFWWSWFGILWATNIFVGGYIFYKKNRTDETKAFWLLVMVILPITGAVAALIFNWKLKSQYGKAYNDNNKLQEAIFQARSSIKIYTNSLFVSNDTLKALNNARWRNVTVQIIMNAHEKKYKQDFIIENLQKYLEDKIQLYLTNKEIESSYIIFDDKVVLTTDKNFNFKYVFSENNIKVDTNPKPYLKSWDNEIEHCSYYSLKKTKLSALKRVKNKIIYIFYPFF